MHLAWRIIGIILLQLMHTIWIKRNPLTGLPGESLAEVRQIHTVVLRTRLSSRAASAEREIKEGTQWPGCSLDVQHHKLLSWQLGNFTQGMWGPPVTAQLPSLPSAQQYGGGCCCQEQPFISNSNRNSIILHIHVSGMRNTPQELTVPNAVLPTSGSAAGAPKVCCQAISPTRVWNTEPSKQKLALNYHRNKDTIIIK